MAMPEPAHREVFASLDSKAQKPTPDVKALALANLTDEEVLEGIREIRTTGGVELQAFLPELKKIAGDERNAG